MTAQLVGHGSRVPLSTKYISALKNGAVQAPDSDDRLDMHDIRGQLWEREAEREPADHVTTGRFRRTHTMSSPVWAFLPLSPAGWCKFYREMDAQYGTEPGTPLHHDGRCPVHASVFYGLTSVDDE